MKRVLVIGGYGNFGHFISSQLAMEDNIQVIIAGRSAEKAKALAQELDVEWAVLDVNDNIDTHLQTIKPDIVIHTSGPFQGQGYAVAEACIRQKCHYIDLADGREFVEGISSLYSKAEEAGVLVVTGASSVPSLTSAIFERYRKDFLKVTSIDYGIATAQQTNAGLATTAAILGYTGKPFSTLIKGKTKTIYGWQGLKARKYPELGWRLLSNCNIPDLTLFPKRYPKLESIEFRAGLEVPLLHLALWALSWPVRIGLIKSLQPLASFFYKMAPRFDKYGTDRSAFHMEMNGITEDGRKKTLTFYILTNSGHGPYIPCIPSILLAKRLARSLTTNSGAFPCMGMITLEEYLRELEHFDIKWLTT